MKTAMQTSFRSHLGGVVLLAGLQFVGAAAPNDAEALANRLVKAGGGGGIVVTLGAPNAELPLAISRQGGFLVHGLYRDPDSAMDTRKTIRGEGVYGTVSTGVLDGNRLPYAGNLINLIVIATPEILSHAAVTPGEIVRTLAPLGTVCLASPSGSNRAAIDRFASTLRKDGGFESVALDSAEGWLAFRKPWPKEIDEWGHYLHGADGNPVAADDVVGPPVHLQWVGGPTWLRSHETDSSISTLVTTGGRLFFILDEAPIGLAGPQSPPDKWSLVARDAFNGATLWKTPIRRWGWREWKPTWFNTRPGDIPLNVQKRLVASGDRVYVTLGYRAPVSQLDAQTGEILQTYADTERAAEILHLNGRLLLSLLGDDGVQVVSLDAESGKRLWATDKRYRGSTTDYIRWSSKAGNSPAAELDPTLNMATDGRTIAFIDGSDVVGLDHATGAEKWRTEFPLADSDKNAGRIQAGNNLWVGTMIVSDGVVIHASPSRLAGFSAADGRQLWTRDKKYIGHLWYEWKDVFVIDGRVWTWGADLETSSAAKGGPKDRSTYPRHANGYNLHTGELEKSVDLGMIFKANHHHRCYRNKATSHFILASRRGTEFVDLEGGHHTVDNWVRSTCHVGMMPANGLQYVPPHPCQCYIDEKLSGFFALAARREAESFPADTPPKLEKGPAFASIAKLAAAEPDAADWPAFRHDNRRTGSTVARVSDEVSELWRVKVGAGAAPPVVVGDRLFTALSDQHHALCLDAKTGRVVWEFAAGGRIDSPPTWHRGTVLFGSADGWVYCLRASDGALAWRFRGGPAERLICAHGQLESAWPVHGSVLVQNETVYFTAGRNSHLDGGLRIFGLDATTGEIRCRRLLDGPHYNVENLKENFHPEEGSLPDILMSDGERIYLRGETFDNDLQPARGKADLRVPGGFLDDNYFKRVPWGFGKGLNYGRLLSFDDDRVCGMRMFDTLRGLDPTVYFTPGDKGYLLFSKSLKGDRKQWSNRQPVRVRAMVMTPDRILAAGPPDLVDPQDPLGAFEGRKGGVLLILDSETGDTVARQTLVSAPVFNGIATSRGRLFMVDVDGGISCYGTP